MMNPPRIDLNCDLAEGIGNERALMPWITSANIACGFHAGDEALIAETVALCVAHGVAIGAHPSFPDRANFGRLPMAMAPDAVTAMVFEQVALLKKITENGGGRLHHVKPHGALYNSAARDPELAHAIVAAVVQVDPRLILYGLSQSALPEAAASAGVACAHEVFADRTYRADGSLTPRTEPHALIEDEADACGQALRLVMQKSVLTTAGVSLSLRADTLCLHGDGKHAEVFARQIFTHLTAAGVTLKPFDPSAA